MSCALLFLDLQYWHFFTLFILPAFLKKEWLFQSRKHARACNGIWFWLCVVCLDSNHLHLKQIYWFWLFTISYHRKSRRLDPTSVCVHLREVQPGEMYRPSLREKIPVYQTQVCGMAFYHFLIFQNGQSGVTCAKAWLRKTSVKSKGEEFPDGLVVKDPAMLLQWLGLLP